MRWRTGLSSIIADEKSLKGPGFYQAGGVPGAVGGCTPGRGERRKRRHDPGSQRRRRDLFRDAAPTVPVTG